MGRNIIRSLLSFGVAASLFASSPQIYASADTTSSPTLSDFPSICSKELRLLTYTEILNRENFVRYKIQLGDFDISFLNSGFFYMYVQIMANSRRLWTSIDGESQSGRYHLISRKLDVFSAEALEAVFERGEESYMGKLIADLPPLEKSLIAIIFNWSNIDSQLFFYTTVGVHHSREEGEGINNTFRYLDDFHQQNLLELGCSVSQ